MTEIDIERLKTDPAYWDEVAPEGAEVYIIDCDPRDDLRMPSEFFYADHDDRTPGRDVWRQCGSRSFWRKDCEDLEVIPRPTEWRGPEDGLPPVGTVALGKMPAWCKEERCKVIAHLHGSCVVVHGIGANPDSWSTLSWCDQFRPLKSDKERAVDAAMKVMPYPGSPSTRADLECAYDAGLLRLPEGQS